MSFLQYLMPEHVAVMKEVSGREQVLAHLGSLLVKTGNVDQAYVGAVLEREQNHPTGLELGEVNAAIPHADPTHVKTPAVALAVVKPGVPFRSMADSGQEVCVQIVFLLAMNKSESHLQLLEEIMWFLQERETLKTLAGLESEEDVMRFLKVVCGEKQGGRMR